LGSTSCWLKIFSFASDNWKNGHAFDILLTLTEQMPSITKFWRSYLENNKTNSSAMIFLSESSIIASFTVIMSFKERFCFPAPTLLSFRSKLWPYFWRSKLHTSIKMVLWEVIMDFIKFVDWNLECNEREVVQLTRVM
jgi:hypothetical protein